MVRSPVQGLSRLRSQGRGAGLRSSQAGAVGILFLSPFPLPPTPPSSSQHRELLLLLLALSPSLLYRALVITVGPWIAQGPLPSLRSVH